MGGLLHGLSVDYPPPNYRGDEAVSWSQLTNHIERNIRTFATRGYVDEKDDNIAPGEYVNKNGDEMAGNLNMNGQLLHGLSKSASRDYRGDEALSYSQVRSKLRHLTNNLRGYIDRLQHKPIISVTAYPEISNSSVDYWGFYEGQG